MILEQSRAGHTHNNQIDQERSQERETQIKTSKTNGEVNSRDSDDKQTRLLKESRAGDRGDEPARLVESRTGDTGDKPAGSWDADNKLVRQQKVSKIGIIGDKLDRQMEEPIAGDLDDKLARPREESRSGGINHNRLDHWRWELR